jgi:hypothetical protein
MFRMKFLDGTDVDEKYAKAVSALVSGAAAAAESFGEDELETFASQPMRYCCQCVDKASGKLGDFIHLGDFHAVSPVFTGLTALFDWMHENGLEHKPGTLWEVRRRSSATDAQRSRA